MVGETSLEATHTKNYIRFFRMKILNVYFQTTYFVKFKPGHLDDQDTLRRSQKCLHLDQVLFPCI